MDCQAPKSYACTKGESTMDSSKDVTQKILRFANFKRLALKQYQHPGRNNGVMDSHRFPRSLAVEETEVAGRRVVTIRPENPDGRHLVFLHGGSYVMEPTVFHRRFIELLAKTYRMTVSYLDYPLAPEADWKEALTMVSRSYALLVDRFPSQRFFLFGDSAGGGLALSFLQMLRDQGQLPLPKRTVLCSPWVDLTLENGKIADYEPLDPVLSVEGLRYAASIWANGEPLDSPMVSPLYGNLENLGDFLLYVGTHELFFPDCLLLQQKLDDAPGSSVSLVLGESLMHDWVLFPLKESKEIPLQIDRFLI
jgi:acetyl esterase/lipase